MRSVLRTIMNYVLWSVSIIINFYLVFLLRSFVLILLEYFDAGQNFIGILDKVNVLILGVITLILIVYLQSLYTKKGWKAFLLISGWQAFVYVGVIVIKNILLHSLEPFLLPSDFLWFGIFIIGGILLNSYFYKLFCSN